MSEILNCAGCGALIKFLVTRTGSRMPVNVPGRRLVVEIEPGQGRVLECFESHFATCPKAASFRASKEKPETEKG